MLFGLFTLFVVILIGVADVGRGRQFFFWVGQIPAGDKVGHLMTFGMMAFLANMALNGARLQLGRFTVLKGSVFVLVPAALEEFSQIFFRARTFDLIDLLADGIGIFLGGLLAVLVMRSLNLSSPRVSTGQSGDAPVVPQPLQGE